MPTNKERAEYARDVLIFYKQLKDEHDVDMQEQDEVDEATTDLMCDLCHLCLSHYSIDIDDLFRFSRKKYIEDLAIKARGEEVPDRDVSAGEIVMYNLYQMQGMSTGTIIYRIFDSSHPKREHLREKLEQYCKGDLVNPQGFLDLYRSLDHKNVGIVDEWMSVKRF